MIWDFFHKSKKENTEQQTAIAAAKNGWGLQFNQLIPGAKTLLAAAVTYSLLPVTMAEAYISKYFVAANPDAAGGKDYYWVFAQTRDGVLTKGYDLIASAINSLGSNRSGSSCNLIEIPDPKASMCSSYIYDSNNLLVQVLKSGCKSATTLADQCLYNTLDSNVPSIWSSIEVKAFAGTMLGTAAIVGAGFGLYHANEWRKRRNAERAEREPFAHSMSDLEQRYGSAHTL